MYIYCRKGSGALSSDVVFLLRHLDALSSSEGLLEVGGDERDELRDNVGGGVIKEVEISCGCDGERREGNSTCSSGAGCYGLANLKFFREENA